MWQWIVGVTLLLAAVRAQRRHSTLSTSATVCRCLPPRRSQTPAPLVSSLLSSALLFSALQFRFLRWFFSPILSSWVDPSPLSYRHSLRIPAATSSDGKEHELPLPQALLFDDETHARPGNRVSLSCIVPAYNESERVQAMLDDALAYLTAREQRESDFSWELLFVDDGSRDDTAAKILSFVSTYGPARVRLLKLQSNQGKGGAVQQGMLHARGDLLLMVDADGATRFADVAKLESALLSAQSVDGQGVAVGSRRHLQQEAVSTRAWHRNLLMYAFHFLVATLTGIGHIKDTQCGFKLFTRRSAQFLFSNQHLRRWCFDVELLFLCVHAGPAGVPHVPTVEVPVNWQEIPGSKINLIESSFLMARDLVLIRLAYTLGVWKRSTWTDIRSEKTHQREADTNQFVCQKDKHWKK